MFKTVGASLTRCFKQAMFLALRKKKVSLRILAGLLRGISLVLVLSFSVQSLAEASYNSSTVFSKRNIPSSSLKTVIGSDYYSFLDNRLTASLGLSPKTPFSFGICNTQIDDGGKILLEKADFKQTIGNQTTGITRSVRKKQISIPLNEMFYSPRESELSFFTLPDQLLGGGLVAIYDASYNRRSEPGETIKYAVPTYSASSSKYPTERETYKQRESEHASSYDSWRTPEPVYLKAPHPTAYLGPSRDLKNLHAKDEGLIIRFFRWLYFDVPWMVVHIFIERPIYIIGGIAFLVFSFGGIGIFILCQLGRKIK
ncbi:MAG: hypothetical protein EOM12_04330 [Verrucomicrobiae bacterium]|nr:hypothetical protein [Verrucomicrobiae bacterium]